MKKVILDTNFIVSCIRNKIDFFEEIKFMGMQILIPKQVIEELKSIINSKKKFGFKKDAKIALQILEKNLFQKIDIGKKYVDKGIVNYSEKNKDVIIATLDRELKNKIKNPKLIIRGKKKLEVV